MTRIEYDVSQTSFRAVLKDYQELALRLIWNSPKGANSRTVWMEVNRMLGGKTISRASIINFLEHMRKTGVLDAYDRTGKGGHQFVYRMGMDEEQFKRVIVITLLESLMRDFSEETKAAIKNVT